MFSKACEYGIKAMVYIAAKAIDGERVKIGDVAANANCPVAFTTKILGLLSKKQLLNSYTGPSGGFGMDGELLKRVKVSDIVYAIDGNGLLKGCVLGLDQCNSDSPCPLHGSVFSAREKIRNSIENQSIALLARELMSGNTFILR